MQHPNRFNIGRTPGGVDVRDHTRMPMDHTREFLEDRGRVLKAPTSRYNHFTKAYRTVESSFGKGEERDASNSRRLGEIKGIINNHEGAVHTLKRAMRIEAFCAIRGIDEWLNSQLRPPQTHGVRINRDTSIDNDRIRTRVLVYVYRLT